ncbi:MAG: hypothetical protein FJ102_11350 [Deltaproteobacteria bacterium]|nr:hypothetical protein [Deltaproteobacteria bacterium]
MILLHLALACVQPAPLPDLGDCADYPAGVYEYGQVGIGTCLAGPSAVSWVGDGSLVAVTNANPWLDFTSGSVLAFDFDNVDLATGRNLVSALDASAVSLPTFSGASTWAEPYGALLVTNRFSGDGRTRESTDSLYFVDVSASGQLSLSTEIGPDDDGGSIAVGYDPNEVVYDEATDIAWTINRTDHSVASIDLASRPARLVPPGGDGRLTPDDFVDADGSGSKASFARLEVETNSGVAPNTWSLSWAAATVRAWSSHDEGIYRTVGNGESEWVRSGVPYEIEVDSGRVPLAETRDPAWAETNGFGTMVFVSEGAIRSAFEAGDGTTYTSYDYALVEPNDDEPVLADPFLVYEEGAFSLFYAGGDGTRSTIRVATSADGADYDRVGTVVEIEGFALGNPSVMYDPQVERWRMWFSATDSAGASSLRHAYSDDLLTWTVDDSASPGLAAPTVAYWSGRFHCLHAGADGVHEATSVDGYTWVDQGLRFVPEAGSHPEDGVALEVADESAFRMVDLDGEVFPYAVTAGVTFSESAEGWSVQVAAGHVLGPDDAPTLAPGGVALTSRLGDQAFLDVVGDGGITRIGTASFDGDTLLIDDDVLVDVAEGTFYADGVHDAVVAEVNGTLTMYFAGDAEGVTSIGRATSTDGATWSIDKAPLYEGVDSFESVEVSPSSVQVHDDGTVRLWYSAHDGDTWRVGLLESTDDGDSFARVDGASAAWSFDGEAPGSWDDSGARDAFVIRDGDLDRMWFSGFDGAAWQLGYAEREVGSSEWSTSLGEGDEPRPVMLVGNSALGAEGLQRPVAWTTATGWALSYTAIDGATPRVGLATAREADRLHRNLALPTVADTWGFTVVPPNDGSAISLDFYLDDAYFTGRGCTSLAFDDAAGLLYVGCKLVPVLFALDVRDDSTSTFADLNYLGVESVLVVQTSSGADSGMRDLVVDRANGWLWGIADEPEALYAIRTDDIVDDATTDLVRDRIIGMLPLPRGIVRDEGVATQANVGPGQMAMHPTESLLFVTNFNDNSLSVYDLSLGPLGTQVGQVDNIGENPYAVAISPDGAYAIVANYSGEVGEHVSSTLVVLDADPASPSFLEPLTWIANQ